MKLSFPQKKIRIAPALTAGALLLCFGALFGAALTPLKAIEKKDFAAPFEPGEDLPGGKATSRKTYKNKNAFSHSSGNMGFEKELLFKVGNGLFRKLWISAPSSTKSSDGLGPLFNARSCQRCHLKDGRGHPPEANYPDDDQVSMFLRLSVPAKTPLEKEMIRLGKALTIPEPTYGGQLQDLSVQGHAGEGRMHITYTPVTLTLGDGTRVELRKPSYKVTNLGYGPLAKDVRLSPRVSPQMIGLGLLELIREADILAHEDIADQNKDGISGRANRVWSFVNNRVMVGRFGWKAGNATVKDQSAGAFSGDLGLSTSLHPGHSGDCTKAQAFCLKAPHGADLKADQKKTGKPAVEVTDEMLDLVTFYSQNLAVPKRRAPKDSDVLKGKALFQKIGCGSCHRARFKTGASRENPHLSHQTIWPYTDLLLHDMGEGLADYSPEGQATGREWRTAPLWGIGLTKSVNGHSYYLHDGRARSLLEAILWHDGEAGAARAAFMALSKEERDQILKFIGSL